MTTALDRLRQYGYELPTPRAPVASYVPVTRSGNILYVSGQISASDAGVVTGRLGDTMNVVQGGNAAELAALNVLAQIVHSAGIDLEAIKRVLKLSVFVCSAPEFNEQHLVANGGSNLIIGVLGDKGRHARSAFGVAALPLGAAVEIEAIVEV
ncbi:Enamine deaminase RidA, house cleaning of reactive enamine intermediates, YjgF/YER057c/UK114 family [Devosia enhydra]|uniref:Enamine deaminase RidA, house cleaning of reactive enamine intermediates, YjgF/YER057c/UK114 family n=1 Tax=Devosia enhydra TaxID=665118 RepID=A0A1K2HUT7_9HYPH|nr:RidA family protein [Devosia enhydra]SFZ81939.1 Enamine deaminase RidA, house cleaning of reactive enamine intermediates, YjgF/YER057c/UK114 family [Devosia enhydra]